MTQKFKVGDMVYFTDKHSNEHIFKKNVLYEVSAVGERWGDDALLRLITPTGEYLVYQRDCKHAAKRPHFPSNI